MLSDHKCECGCGQYTNVAKRTYGARGVRKGEPFRFVAGHQSATYTVDQSTGCWIGGSVNSSGYSGHREMYRRAMGPIPDGLVLDHLCRNRACVNPAHLEPVTQSENLFRILGGVCGRGHDTSGDLGWTDTRGYRRCRVCNAEKSRRQRERARATA